MQKKLVYDPRKTTDQDCHQPNKGRGGDNGDIAQIWPHPYWARYCPDMVM